MAGAAEVKRVDNDMMKGAEDALDGCLLHLSQFCVDVWHERCLRAEAIRATSVPSLQPSLVMYSVGLAE